LGAAPKEGNFEGITPSVRSGIAGRRAAADGVQRRSGTVIPTKGQKRQTPQPLILGLGPEINQTEKRGG
jgi:hypothetical protein